MVKPSHFWEGFFVPLNIVVVPHHLFVREEYFFVSMFEKVELLREKVVPMC